MNKRARRPPRRPAGLSLTVQYATSAADLPARSLLRRWVRAALYPGTRRATITLRFVDAAEGRALNRRYRTRPGPTNVLSFVYDDEPGRCRGDIVLCAPVLRSEAAAQGKPFMAHCAHLVVHGMLHLQGAVHDEPADAARMEADETRILGGLGIPDPYVSRTPRVRRAKRPR